MDLPTRMRLEACASGETEIARIDNLGREDAKKLIDARWWRHDFKIRTSLDDEPDSHWKWREIISYYQNDRNGRLDASKRRMDRSKGRCCYVRK